MDAAVTLPHSESAASARSCRTVTLDRFVLTHTGGRFDPITLPAAWSGEAFELKTQASEASTHSRPRSIGRLARISLDLHRPLASGVGDFIPSCTILVPTHLDCSSLATSALLAEQTTLNGSTSDKAPISKQNNVAATATASAQDTTAGLFVLKRISLRIQPPLDIWPAHELIPPRSSSAIWRSHPTGPVKPLPWQGS